MSSVSSSSFPASLNSSSSSSGGSDDDVSLDATEYPTVFLLAIFLPALAVGVVFLYFHYSLRHWGELRWPWSAFGAKRRRVIASSQPAGGGVNLVAELRNELSGVSGGIGPNDSFIGGHETVSPQDRPAGHAMHRPLLADNIF